MPAVHTVLGPRDPADLGQVLMHEHLLFDTPAWQENPLVTWDRAAALDLVTGRVNEAKAAGLGTFVDCTPIGCARDPEFMQEIARRTGVIVVAATGFWISMGITGYYAQMSVDQLTAIMVHELTSGMAHTDVRAGIIKVASSEGVITPEEERAIRAAGRAQAQIGCTVTTHTSRSTMGREQVDLMLDGGADVARLIIGHSDDRDDVDYLRAILSRGANVEFDHVSSGDRFGVPEKRKAEILATLVNEGYAGQLTLSHDTVGQLPGNPKRSAEPLFQRPPTYILTTFVPMLREAGVPEQAIHQMLVDNPARLLPF